MELHQVSLLSRYHRIAYVDHHEEHASAEVVQVHLHKTAHPPEEAVQVVAGEGTEDPAAVPEFRGYDAVCQAAVLRNDGAERDTVESEAFPAADAQGKDYARDYVHHVDHQVGPHRTDRILHAYEPSPENHQGKGCRCSPDAYEEVAGGERLHRGTAVGEEHHRLEIGPLDEEHPRRHRERERKAAAEYPAAVPQVAASESLCGEPSGADAQEAETPVEQREKHGTDGDGAYEFGGAGTAGSREMACYGGVHHTHYGHGDVGQYARKGEPQDFLVEAAVHRNFWSSSSIPR